MQKGRHRTLLVTAALSLFLAAWLGACGEATGPGTVASIEITPSSPTLDIVDTVQLSATLKDASGRTVTGPQVTWKSEDPAVVGVNGIGIAAARGEGTARIRATADGAEGTVDVTVVRIPVSSVEIQPAIVDLDLARQVRLKAVIKAEDGRVLLGRQIVWATEDPAVTVTPQGVVTAVKRGTAAVTGISEGVAAQSQVTVEFRLTSVSAGVGIGCGLTEKAQAYCWGQNASGLLGIGLDQGPDECGAVGLSRPCSQTPRPVVGSIRFASVAAGSAYACGVDDSGVVYCWGRNRMGQLGLGDRFDRSEPTPVPFPRAMRSVHVGSQSSCALTVTGEAECWGLNSSGQIGDGTTDDRLTPVQVAGTLRFASLAVGADFACGLTETGSAYCWGSNQHGQLGIGDGGPDRCGDPAIPCALTPQPVTGDLSFTQVTANGHACGLTVGGEAYCWGANDFGELGDGTQADRSVPTKVFDGLTFESISAGDFHTCGLATDRGARCWGANFAGQLGIGMIDGARATPTPVLADEFRALGRLGGSHTCAIGGDGNAYCWGSNFTGELGDGTTVDRSSPVLVAGQ